MNRFALLLATGVAVMCSQPGFCDRVDRPHDWTVTIQTERLQRQFEYTGSHIRPVVKANIKYYKQTDVDNKTAYQNMWFNNGKSLGLERLHKFSVDRGDGVAIEVTHKTPDSTLAERKAAANALVHMVLDSYLNKNAVAIARVPLESYDDIANEMQTRHNFIPQAEVGADHPVASGINVFLQSEPAGRSQTLQYF